MVEPFTKIWNTIDSSKDVVHYNETHAAILTVMMWNCRWTQRNIRNEHHSQWQIHVSVVRANWKTYAIFWEMKSQMEVKQSNHKSEEKLNQREQNRMILSP